jgi:hypothetical protein
MNHMITAMQSVLETVSAIWFHLHLQEARLRKSPLLSLCQFKFTRLQFSQRIKVELRRAARQWTHFYFLLVPIGVISFHQADFLN